MQGDLRSRMCTTSYIGSRSEGTMMNHRQIVARATPWDFQRYKAFLTFIEKGMQKKLARLWLVWKSMVPSIKNRRASIHSYLKDLKEETFLVWLQVTWFNRGLKNFGCDEPAVQPEPVTQPDSDSEWELVLSE